MASRRSPGRILINRILGIIVFFLVIFLVNALGWFYPDPTYLVVVKFINSNIGLLLLTSVLMGLGDVFRALAFPLNLPAPILHAVASVFIVYFIANVFSFIGFDDMALANTLVLTVMVFVFFVVLIVGYALIFADLGKDDAQSEGSAGSARARRR